jgi:hypothetical protein
MNRKTFFYKPEIKVIGFGKARVGLWLLVIISRMFGIELSISIKPIETRSTRMKKGRFAFRLRFIRFLVETLMKDDIDEYAGNTIVARRNSKKLTVGFDITEELIQALSATHSVISTLENTYMGEISAPSATKKEA